MRVPEGLHITQDEAATIDLGRRMGAALPDGAWVVLVGPLGAGKTAFVRGLAEGLGIDPALIHSPTFTLVSEHRAGRGLAHVDLYRIEDARELGELGLDDLRERKMIVAVEWGERLPAALRAGAWIVTLRPVSANERHVDIRRG